MSAWWKEMPQWWCLFTLERQKKALVTKRYRFIIVCCPLRGDTMRSTHISTHKEVLNSSTNRVIVRACWYILASDSKSDCTIAGDEIPPGYGSKFKVGNYNFCFSEFVNFWTTIIEQIHFPLRLGNSSQRTETHHWLLTAVPSTFLTSATFTFVFWTYFHTKLVAPSSGKP